MKDADLTKLLYEKASADHRLKFLSADAANELIDRIAIRFIRDANSTWWWTSLTGPTLQFSYEQLDESLALLKQIIANKGTSL